MANTITWRAVDDESKAVLAESKPVRSGSWEEVDAECDLRDQFRGIWQVTLERVDDGQVTRRVAAAPRPASYYR